jgi:uncharacterized protein (DUF2236 family)
MVLRIQDVSHEGILLAGGACAILLQLADPVVAGGVAEHSDFASRPLDRLRGTLTYLYVIVYGTPDEARGIARQVGDAHRSVPGADDVDRQLWVAATIYDTAMRVRELVYGELSAEDAESLLADYSVIATALGVPPAAWPANRTAFTQYWAQTPLDVGDAARAVATELLYPRHAPWWVRLLMPSVRVITAGLLDAPLCEAYGLANDERRFRRLLRTARSVYPRLPAFVRHAPKRHYLRAFRRAQRRPPRARHRWT